MSPREPWIPPTLTKIIDGAALQAHDVTELDALLLELQTEMATLARLLERSSAVHAELVKLRSQL